MYGGVHTTVRDRDEVLGKLDFWLRDLRRVLRDDYQMGINTIDFSQNVGCCYYKITWLF